MQRTETPEIAEGNLAITVTVVPGVLVSDTTLERVIGFAISGLHLCILQRIPSLDLANNEGETTVTQESTFVRLGHTITVKAQFGYRKANLETALAEMLAYAMLDMYSLPDLLDKFIREDAKRRRPVSTVHGASSQAGLAALRGGIGFTAGAPASKAFEPLDPPRVNAADIRAASMAQHPSSGLQIVPSPGRNGF